MSPAPERADGGAGGASGREPGAGASAVPTSALGPGAEFDLIRSFLARGGALPTGVRVGPGDDCAVLEGGAPWAVSCDLAVEGVHFRRDWLSAREVGWRAAAGALSDLAAMAAEPVAVLASLAVPVERAADGFAAELEEGLHEAAASVGAAVVGGDLTRSPGPVAVDVVVLGRAEPPLLLRSAATPGDAVWVTGRLGGAAAAVAALEAGRTPASAHRAAYARPVPRVAEARWLVERAGARAGLDLSDGLLGDAGHLAAASGVAVEIDPAAVPRAEGVEDPALALSGGDDYELLLAAPDDRMASLAEAFEARFHIPLTRVGRVLEGRGVRTADGGAVDAGGWDHFRAAGS